METLKPLVYICPECTRSYTFAFQTSMDTFIGLHAVQHKMQSERWANLNKIEWTKFDLTFLKACGVQV